MSKYSEICQKYQNELIESLRAFVAIDSVYDEKTKSKEDPFGKGVSKALNFFTDLAKKDGFKVTNYDNMVVELLVGEGDKNITIMAHADVVPVGTGWDFPPFEMQDKDGVLYGRGVADDKGPLLASYYALKALRDNNLLGNYQVRFLVGGNEESGSLGIYHYFHDISNKQPTLGFSPDADFPLIFAEKGIIGFEVKKHIDIPFIDVIKGGVASNSVIERCLVKMNKDIDFINYLINNDIKHEVNYEENKMNVSFIGKAAHGAVPQMGINAGIIAIRELGKYYQIEEFNDLAYKYSDVYGRNIDAYSYSEDMFENSVNVGLMSYENNEFSLVVNFRYVNTADPEDLMNRIKISHQGFEVIEHGRAKLLYFPKDSVLVKTLMQSYQEETNDYEAKPHAIGGGTYAKEADNVVAFGMEFEGWDSKMHSPGECSKKEDLFKALNIYANAIIALGKQLEKDEN